ncbi:TEX36 protein, partial [Eudromia elegans]|nr:TEX36 protein [Eudromia elegans]
FAHLGLCQGQLESTTGSALKQGQDAGEVQYVEERLPPGYRARQRKAVNNNFPFSSHDNRHGLQNVGEYFDFVST